MSVLLLDLCEILRPLSHIFFFFNDTATTEIYTLSLHDALPIFVPQLKSITIGGAAAGVGIEASSFRYGLVHDTLLALEVLLADGSVVTCAPDNKHRDLFYGFPNSYGTLGYALKVTARTVPVKPYVRLQHVRHTQAEKFFEDLEARC